MKHLSLVVVALALAATLGCGDDDDGSGGVLLAQGTKTLTTGTDVAVVEVEVTQPGTLQARLTWSGGPTEVGAYFLQIGPTTVLGITQSPSSLVSTVAVTAARVADGHDWRFVAINSAGPDVSAEYVITFVPE